ncbi:tetratricopeptide repeat protein [Glaciecola siphonariae]|uniref:Tetratricopeptide repeat protein n=1 Tax=Glaciecola siphonariae TaxID=521012 RepID=A0ABV9LV31_9ALTE
MIQYNNTVFNRCVRSAFALVICMTLGACTVLTPHTKTATPEFVFNDSVFPAAHLYPIEAPDSIFALSDEAKDFVSNAISQRKTQEGQVKDLMGHIFDRAEFDLLYQADANTNATETFENRAANCLSLTIMTYAMARHAGFNARFQQLNIPEYWTRRGGYTLLNGHINLRIVPKYTVSSINLIRRNLIIDFDPQDGAYEFNADELDKTRIVSMYYNNKGAELILKGELNHAYAYLKSAVKTDPSFEGAWLNLGLVYRQAGALDLAESAYLAAIAIDDDYLTAWENLAAVYDRTSREEQARQIYADIETKRRANPYYHMMLAEEALDKEQYDESIRHFKKAISLDDAPHQFYFGMAQAYIHLGDVPATKRYLTRAKRKAGKSRVAEDYADKLSMLAHVQNR